MSNSDVEQLLSEDSFELRTLVSLIYREVDPERAAHASNLADKFSKPQLKTISKYILENGAAFMCSFLGVEEAELNNTIDLLVEDSPALPRAVESPRSMILSTLEGKDLDVDRAPKEVVNRALNRIYHILEQPLNPEEAALISRSIKELLSTGTHSSSEQESIEGLINDQL